MVQQQFKAWDMQVIQDVAIFSRAEDVAISRAVHLDCGKAEVPDTLANSLPEIVVAEGIGW